MLRTHDNTRHTGVLLVALLCALTSLFATSHVAFATGDEAPPVVMSDYDLQHHLELRQVAVGRLYVHLTRREWAGAAAGMMAARSAAPSRVAPEHGAAAPTPRPVATGGVWDRLAQCEATGGWAANTGNGFYGGLQFTLGTWRAYGGIGMPNEASRDQQIAVGERVLAGQGPGAWPHCSYHAGLR